MTKNTPNRFITTIAGQRLEYLGIGAAHWPAQSMLILADLHLGKSATFRRSGVPIPEGSDQQTLTRLRQAFELTSAKKLLILGDLVHSRGGWSDRLTRQIRDLQQSYPEILWQLVLGNHDRGSIARLTHMGIELLQPPYQLAPFTFFHEPPEAVQQDDSQSPREVEGTACDRVEFPSFFMAGHLHPCVVMGSRGGSRIRLKCFWQSPHGLVLPAFGEFTGGSNCSPAEHDRMIGIANGELIEIFPVAKQSLRRTQSLAKSVEGRP
jgi:metallophosphoesterase superfamily enzyme